MLLQQIRRPVHASWLVGLLCLGVCIGVFLSSKLSIPLYSATWVIGAGIIFAGCILNGKMYIVPLVLLAGGMVGLWRGNTYQLELTPYQALIGKSLTLTGKVTEDSDTGRRGEIVLRLSNIVVDNHEIEGSIWTSSSGKGDVKRGDIVTLQGKLDQGFGSFTASMYRAEVLKVERPVPGDIALAARDWFAGGVRRAIPEPEASLGVGYIVGQRRSLPEELDTALKAAGLTHVVVASGYNLTILVGVARRLFVGISKFLATFFSVGMILGFIAVTGMSSSMSRAGLVTGMGLLAWYYGRRFHPFVLLPTAAAITLLIHPAYGNNDLGWQLSFASFAGVLIVAPLLQEYFFGDEPGGVVRNVLFETLSAWLCTVPLIIGAFEQFSNVAILANILVLPLVPLAMLLTFLAGVAALVAPPVALLAGLPALIVLGYMTKVAVYLGSVPWAQTELTISPLAVAVYYLALGGCGAYIWRQTRFNFITQSKALL